MVDMDATKTLLTFEEFEQLPARPGKSELLKGELIELPPAEADHNRIAHRIHKRLDTTIAEAHTRGEAAQLGEVFLEMGYRLADNSWVQPDVSVTHAGQRQRKYLEGSPAIAIEIVSPGNTASAMDAKVEQYFRFGALEVWMFYPATRRAWIHKNRAAQCVLEHAAMIGQMLG